MKYSWLTIPVFLVASFGLGAGATMWLVTASPWAEEEHAEDQSDAAEDDHDHEHIDLTREAFDNLGLDLQRVVKSDYPRYLQVPGHVVERPTFSNRAQSTPVAAIVSEVLVTPGQAVSPGTPMFRLRVIDEQLINAQVLYLDALTQLKVIDKELARIQPLTETGSIVGRRSVELTYDRQKTMAQRDVRQQELMIRGLTQNDVNSIAQSGNLVTTVTLHAPTTPTMSEEIPVSDQFTVERILVEPGQTVDRGADLCHLAYHSSLFIEGQAFEDELEQIARLSQEGRKLQVEFGIEGSEKLIEDLTILYFDNHVDEQTQTFNFYVPLKNEILSDRRDPSDRRYTTWQYKPGQRVHLRLPVEWYRQQIVLPRQAVVRDGNEALVYIQHGTYNQGPLYMAMEPVPVTVVFQDTKKCVIAPNGKLKVGQRVAMNRAYELNLSQKAGSGGGHDHPHPH